MTEYPGVAETAKLVRRALREAFPARVFAVRPHRYPGGASVSVKWTGPPPAAEVDNVVRPYAGAEFNVMTEAKADRLAWLAPDGRVGEDEAEGARQVRFGADYIFTEQITADAPASQAA